TGINLQESFENKLDIKTKRDHDRHQNNKKLQ
ncbi:pyrophosphatase, partial [Flavobacteriaceae bacterium]|nr:pyrophosphatase [Flavobacteriaceae bacterium]